MSDETPFLGMKAEVMVESFNCSVRGYNYWDRGWKQSIHSFTVTNKKIYGVYFNISFATEQKSS